MNPAHIIEQLTATLQELGYRDRGPMHEASGIGPGRLLKAATSTVSVHLTADPDSEACHARFIGIEELGRPWSVQTDGPALDYAAVVRASAAARTAHTTRPILEIAENEYGWARLPDGLAGIELRQRPSSCDVLMAECAPAAAHPGWQVLLPDTRPCGVREIHGRGPAPANLLRALIFETDDSPAFPGLPETEAGARLTALGFTVARHQVTGWLDCPSLTHLADHYQYTDHVHNQLISVLLSRFPSTPGTFAEIGGYPVGTAARILLESGRSAHATYAPVQLPADTLAHSIESEVRRLTNF